MNWTILGIPEDTPETVVVLLNHDDLDTTSADLLPGAHLPDGALLFATPGDALLVIHRLLAADLRMFPAFSPLLAEVSEPIAIGMYQVRRVVVPFHALDHANAETGDLLGRLGIPLVGMELE